MRMNLVCLAGAIALAGCDYTPPAQATAEGSGVGGTGQITYTHDDLGNRKHMVAVTAAPGIAETEGAIGQRIHQFALRFAAQECPQTFTFIDDPNMTQDRGAGFMKRTRTYVFICQ